LQIIIALKLQVENTLGQNNLATVHFPIFQNMIMLIFWLVDKPKLHMASKIRGGSYRV